jgi:hypothetical protein
VIRPPRRQHPRSVAPTRRRPGVGPRANVREPGRHPPEWMSRAPLLHVGIVARASRQPHQRSRSSTAAGLAPLGPAAVSLAGRAP